MALNYLVLGVAVGFSLVLGSVAEGNRVIRAHKFWQNMQPTGEMLEFVQNSGQIERTDEWVSITGVRLTEGNAVECPKIRDKEGLLHAVSYLTPEVTLGTAVIVRGYYAITTTCVGKVLVVEEQKILED